MKEWMSENIDFDTFDESLYNIKVQSFPLTNSTINLI